MSEILKISGLRAGYSEEVDVLHGISISFREGEAVGIIGLNGSGKSTFGKAIMNMIPYRYGKIVFDSADVTTLSTCQLASRGLSIMQQGGVVFQSLSVWDNLVLAFSSETPDTFENLQTIFPILQAPKKNLQHLMACNLSGGQRHQLALAMALATRPKLLILDEPSAGLSPKAIEEIFTIMQTVRERMKMTVLLIEQNIRELAAFSDTCILMSNGAIAEQFSPGDLERIIHKHQVQVISPTHMPEPENNQWRLVGWMGW